MGKLFDGILGQKRVITLLSSHVKTGDFSHAYLFSGPNGSGKEYIAKRFSKYILCGSGKDDNCKTCSQFEKGIHSDFIVLDDEKSIKIDEVRNAMERINLSPNAGEKKVLFVKNAENLTEEAANALLKTLEEPPRNSVIVLTTNSIKKLPETIASRSQQIKLSLLSEEDIEKILSTKFINEDMKKIIELSSGNIGFAEELARNDEFLKEKEKTLEDAEFIFEKKSVAEKFKIIEEKDKNGGIREFFNVFSAVLFTSIKDELAGQESRKCFKGYSLRKKQELAEKILKIYRNLGYNVSLRINLEEIILEDMTNA
jgi:DNA polymerase-3 subunit delta'